MTRSAAKRQNRNARMIVALAKVADVALLYGRDGAFTADTARRLVGVWNFYLFCDVPLEVNWPLCAELLNRKAQRHWYATVGVYRDAIREAAPSIIAGVFGGRPLTGIDLLRYGRMAVKSPAFIKTWIDS